MSWKNDWKNNITTADDLKETIHLSDREYEEIKHEIKTFPMSITRYYASLIDANNPNDPIKKLSVPLKSGLDGMPDQSGEKANTVIPGIQHKYKQTTLVLTTTQCAMYCRHCFRRRFVGTEQEVVATNPLELKEYILKHPEITNVLLSGGDAFLMNDEQIKNWLSVLSEIEQLDFIRFGTRTPVTFPQRINDKEDNQILQILSEYNKRKQIYVITHFNHPKEFTPQSIQAIKNMQNCGIVIKNQTVLLNGINDNPQTLAEVLRLVTKYGIVQHYIFQCRPVIGTQSHFQVPFRRGFDIISKANAMQNGIGKTADYTLSHHLGKIRVIGQNKKGKFIFQFKQAHNPELIGKTFELYLSPDQTWLEEKIILQAINSNENQ